MAITTPEMNKLASDFINWALVRDGEMIKKHAIEDCESEFICFHTSPKRPDRRIKVLTDYVVKTPPAGGTDYETNGWYVDDVAWCVSNLSGLCPDRVTKLPLRATVIMRRVKGEWKVAQLHLSEAVDRAAQMVPRGLK